MIPKPIGVRVLVKTLDEDREKIWTPPGALRSRRGVVVEKGDDVRYLEVADEILFASEADPVYAFVHEDERYFVMPEGCVLVVLSRHPAAAY